MVMRMLGIFLLIATVGNAQPYTRAGLLRATATISPSFSVGTSTNNVYLSGEFEGFLTSNISLRGDILGLVGTLEEKQDWYGNHHLLVGPQFHRSRGIADFYTGFQVGASYLGYQNWNASTFHRDVITPNFAVNAGVTWYVFDYFNFFANARYLHSTYRGYSFGTMHTRELVISAGLGFHIHTKKKN